VSRYNASTANVSSGTFFVLSSQVSLVAGGAPSRTVSIKLREGVTSSYAVEGSCFQGYVRAEPCQLSQLSQLSQRVCGLTSELAVLVGDMLRRVRVGCGELVTCCPSHSRVAPGSS
jgi:hypothetical protein